MSVEQAETFVRPECLCIGLYIHVGLPWTCHPFGLNSFKIKTEDQIRQLRALNVAGFQFDPAKSDTIPPDLPVAPNARAAAGPLQFPGDAAEFESKRRRAALIAERRSRIRQVEKALVQAGAVMRNVNRNLLARPVECLQEAGALIDDMVRAFLEQPEVSLHVLVDKCGGEEIYYHGLNTSILAMMVARELEIGADECRLLGLGALLHDIGLADVPDRVRLRTSDMNHAEREMRKLHCEFGLRMARRIGLPPVVQDIIYSHHEMADGSGYPRGLPGSQTPPLARLVALVNYYDNLCNPAEVTRALTPHEALSFMFAQRRGKFDSRALQALIRCLGVYPPGTLVRLSNEAVAMVSSVNPHRPLRPWVVLYDPQVPKEEALMLDLDQELDINISTALRPAQLPAQIYEYLSPRRRITYFFDADTPLGGRS